MRTGTHAPNPDPDRPPAPKAIETLQVASPIGELLLGAGDGGLSHLVLPGTVPPPELGTLSLIDGGQDAASHAYLLAAAAQLGEYFAGARRSFDLVLDPCGTEFQRKVWLALADIGYGTTISYAALAGRVGRPKAYRAVGQANGRNPLAIILPCHRVIASGGGIGGYGGGLDMKRRLLALEGAEVPDSR